MAKNVHKQPLVHIVKRKAMPVKKAIAIRAAAIVIALLLCGVIAMMLAKTNPVKIYGAMLKGAFGTKNKIWNLLQDIAILLCTATRAFSATLPVNSGNLVRRSTSIQWLSVPPEMIL